MFLKNLAIIVKSKVEQVLYTIIKFIRDKMQKCNKNAVELSGLLVKKHLKRIRINLAIRISRIYY